MIFSSARVTDLIIAKELQRAENNLARTTVIAGVSTEMMEADTVRIRNLGTVPQDHRYVRCVQYTSRRNTLFMKKEEKKRKKGKELKYRKEMKKNLLSSKSRD